MQIAQITAATAEALAAINALLPDLSATAQPLTMAQLQTIVDDSNSHLYIMHESETAVGMFTLCATHHPCGCTVWMEDVVVAAFRQGQGFGRHLVESAIDVSGRLYPNAQLMLTSRPSRAAANHIYSQLMERKETNVYYKSKESVK